MRYSFSPNHIDWHGFCRYKYRRQTSSSPSLKCCGYYPLGRAPRPPKRPADRNDQRDFFCTASCGITSLAGPLTYGRSGDKLKVGISQALCAEALFRHCRAGESVELSKATAWLIIVLLAAAPAVADGLSVPAPQCLPAFEPGADGTHISAPDFATAASPGDPALPYKDLYVILPPNADPSSVSLSLADDSSRDPLRRRRHRSRAAYRDRS